MSLLINTRIQVLFGVGGTPRTWEVAPGLAGALGAPVSGGVLWSRSPHPEFFKAPGKVFPAERLSYSRPYRGGTLNFTGPWGPQEENGTGGGAQARGQR